MLETLLACLVLIPFRQAAFAGLSEETVRHPDLDDGAVFCRLRAALAAASANSALFVALLALGLDLTGALLGPFFLKDLILLLSAVLPTLALVDVALRTAQYRVLFDSKDRRIAAVPKDVLFRELLILPLIPMLVLVST